jgi:hypothetical protein
MAFVDAVSGLVRCYSERQPPRRTALKDVKITKAQAMVAGADAVASRGQYRLKTVLLILSSLLAPDQGPVWQLGYEPENPQASLPPTVVAIDAMTGRDITPHAAGPPAFGGTLP